MARGEMIATNFHLCCHLFTNFRIICVTVESLVVLQHMYVMALKVNHVFFVHFAYLVKNLLEALELFLFNS